jgi:1-acyl-sn-glycerol-3-phosphate acyltransferase
MKRILINIRSLLIWAIALPIAVLCALAILIVSLFSRGPLLDGTVKLSCRLVVLCCGVRVRWHNTFKIKKERRYLVMLNHVNFLDAFVFYSGFPMAARGFEESGHFRWPLYGAVMSRIGMVPIDRKRPARALRNLEHTAKLIGRRPHFSYGIMPEGTRTPDGRLGAFKRGGFLLALATGLEILPIVQIGAHAVNRKGSLLIKPGVVEMVVCDPIPTADYSRETIPELMAATRAAMEKTLETASGKPGLPPAPT